MEDRGRSRQAFLPVHSHSTETPSEVEHDRAAHARDGEGGERSWRAGQCASPSLFIVSLYLWGLVCRSGHVLVDGNFDMRADPRSPIPSPTSDTYGFSLSVCSIRITDHTDTPWSMALWSTLEASPGSHSEPFQLCTLA